MPIILRFRDLNIPLGETISRHSRIISERGHVWWGWIRRQREEFPSKFFATVATSCHAGSPMPIWLYDSGVHQLHSARLARIWAAPGGPPLPSPETRYTPTYMSEAILSAWFKLVMIDEKPIQAGQMTIEEFPTLQAQTLGDHDQGLMNKTFDDLSILRHSEATLWKGTATGQSQ